MCICSCLKFYIIINFINCVSACNFCVVRSCWYFCFLLIFCSVVWIPFIDFGIEFSSSASVPESLEPVSKCDVVLLCLWTSACGILNGVLVPSPRTGVLTVIASKRLVVKAMVGVFFLLFLVVEEDASVFLLSWLSSSESLNLIFFGGLDLSGVTRSMASAWSVVAFCGCEVSGSKSNLCFPLVFASSFPFLRVSFSSFVF